MHRLRQALKYRKVWLGIAGTAFVGLMAIAPPWGYTTTTAPLWTERPVAVTSAVAPAPDWVELARALKPAVVNISARRMDERAQPESPFRRFFEPFEPSPRRPARSMGSGFIVNPSGHIVTNNHVVEGASEIRVKIHDGRELTAKVVGSDPKTDLALLKVEATGLPVIPLGNSSELRVGEQVMAIGNPFGLEQTVTTGIVSATGRVIGQGPYDDFIQTDASINPGNSGGPLINSRGQAIGINAAIFSQSGGSVGIGFAIPVDQAKAVVTQLASAGKVTRGWLGVSIQPLTPELARGFKMTESSGALVSSVQESSPAAKAGIKPGDVITQVDGQKIAQASDVAKLVAAVPVGRQVPVTVMREGKVLTLAVTVAQMDEPGAAAATNRADAPNGRLGLAVESLTPEMANELKVAGGPGVVVRHVRSGSPAENAGIRPGDVITEVDRQAVADVAQMKQVLDKHPAGTPVVAKIHRDGASQYVALSS